MEHLRQLPSEIHRILHTEIESLSAHRGMHVRRVAGEKDASVAILSGLPSHIGEPRYIVGAPKTKVRPANADECLPNVAQSWLFALARAIFAGPVNQLLVQHGPGTLAAVKFGNRIHA